MSIRVAILDDYQSVALSMADWPSIGAGVAVHPFHERLGREDDIAERLRNFDVIVAMRERTPLPATLIGRLPLLKLIVTTGRRNAAIDVNAAAARGVVVCGTSTLSQPPVELTWGLILSLARSIPRESAAMRAGAWQSTMGIGLHGKTLGVIGLGRLGTDVARIGKAFGMQVIAWSQNLTRDRTDALGVELVAKDALFQRADIVTVHLVLGDRTRGIVGERELAMMKPTALLINTARGPIVDEHALIHALRHSVIAGAALDVFDEEPLPVDHPLRRLENALLTPHLGYVTTENYRLAYGEAVEDIRAFLAGAPVRVIA
ncbi:MAG TPA: D-2-hydroxyacid dehydrogenase family protein [Vicinamibacterales bacterium]|nr:D-2-hydroxyacid dehydrogenase family protein [Vicinamibacterales bacterium]